MEHRVAKHHGRTIDRRRFLSAAAAGTAGVVSPTVVTGQGKRSPIDKMHIACVGLGAMGYTTLENCIGTKNLGSPRLEFADNVVALCDVDWRRASVPFRRFPKATKFKDYRRMLDEVRGIDAVVVATPDHTHAVITAEAMRRGKHVYTQMPLAHDVREARRLAEIARETGVTTQMGNQRHSSPVLRKTRAWIRAGAVGTVREVHCWTREPTWPRAAAAAPGGRPVPKGLDWDLWLGPAPVRAYNPAYHPYNWRAWRDFGSGALGALGCHVMDAPFWILELDKIDRFRVEAESQGMSEQGWPASSHVRYVFPACDDRPELTVHWYDGGRRPAAPEGMPPRRELDANGAIFVGDKGTLTCGDVVNVNDPDDDLPLLLPESRWKSFEPPRKVDRLPGSWEHDWLGNHEHLWLEACRKGEKPCSHFEYSAALTEMVLLGNVALQAGEPIEWDRQRMEVVSPSDANRYVGREYRKGWSI